MTPEIRRSLVQHSRLRQDPHAVLRRLLDRVPPGLRLDEPAKQLEQRIADLLGKPAALFFPTGTMAQQTAMRVHAERTGRRTFAAHPQCHLAIWEDEGYSAVHGLRYLAVGDREDLITLDALVGVREPIAALLLELPQREIGGLLPTWDDLVAQTKWARDGGAAAHCVPQTPLFHVHIPAPKDAVAAAAKRILAESGVELPQRPKSSPDPTRCSIELTIGVVSLDFTPQEVADLIRRLR